MSASYVRQIVVEIQQSILSMWLYRYRDLGIRTEEILQTNRLFYTSPTAFNDPFDCDLQLDLRASKKEYEEMIADAAKAAGRDPAEAIKRAKHARPHSNPAVHAAVKAIVDGIRQNSSLCCFAAKGHNILMFSHYADCHRGICLQFSPDARARLGIPLRVTYGDDYPELRYIKLRNRDGKLTKSLFLSKHTDWKYEEEWRVVRLNQPAGHVSFLPSDLTGIIFGCKTVAADVTKVRKLLRVGGANPILYRANVSRSKFELEVKRI